MIELEWPLLQDNTSRLDAETDDVRRARLLADRVGLLARHGLGPQAVALLPEVRDAVFQVDDGEAFVRLAIAECVACYYGPQAHASPELGRVAVQVAHEQRMPALEAEAALWCLVAHKTFDVLDSEDMGGWLALALSQATPRNESTRARAHYVLGSILLQVGEQPAGASRCAEALRLARGCADRQLCDLIEHHPLTVEMIRLRALIFHDAAPAAALENLLARLRAAAAEVRFGHRRAQLHLNLACMLRLVGCHDEAMRLFDRFLPQGRPEGLTTDVIVSHSDRAVCLARTGEIASALTEAREVARGLALRVSVSTRAALLVNLSEVRAMSGDPAEAARLRADAADAWNVYDGTLARHREALVRRGLHLPLQEAAVSGVSRGRSFG